MNYKAIVAYDGTNYHGWAIQPNNISIQETIEKNLSKILNKKTKIFGSGRTDAYVHAYNQVFSFKTTNTMKPKEICNSLNRILPNDIFIKSIKLVDDLFNARFSAKSKTYIYKISNDVNGVFINNYTLKYNKPLNIKKMKQAANLLIGKHNFLSFSISEVEDTVRVIKSIKITNNGSVTLITITGNGFLRAMVRMIVGMLLDVNENKKTLDDVKNLLSNPKKGSSITKVKACGLYLNKVKY